ncbi:exported hypothetical protein [Candidatus Desulfosporosinus infrequens]|uniref:Uncharacterized protein n=1 Tax=Candidatus Desulfosporosinus infrequens TaxID=2043169 RepID=A0A2U3K900_9FIRM|nr:exported hypothetical protein [Candidatus Desulfosporosinus infrequens]
MKKLISACLLVISLLLVNVVPAFASHYGDAVYRDGVLGGLTWHAAINNYSTVGSYVIEAPGGSGVVQYSSWATFLSGHTYQGPPQYKSGMTDNDLNNVLNTAIFLANRANVSYTAIDMMHGTTTGTYIDPGHVTQLRCDGLVEYCYEWYNWPVLTDTNGNWDISNNNSMLYHSSNYYTWDGYTFNPVTQWSHMNPHY